MQAWMTCPGRKPDNSVLAAKGNLQQTDGEAWKVSRSANLFMEEQKELNEDQKTKMNTQKMNTEK